MRSTTARTQLRRAAERVPAWAYDSAIALAITAVSLLLGHDRTPQGWSGLDGPGVLLTCAVNLPLVVRRRNPVVLCVAVLTVWTVYVALDYWPVVNTLGPLLALYTVAAQRPLRQAVLCALLLAGVWNFAGMTGQESSWATVLGQSLLYTSVICGFGHLARKSAQRNVELADLTRQLRRERAGAERRAVAEERVRIARELHDVVAHHMSVISVQAGLAGYVFDSDPQTARGALGTISDTSTEALAELRRLLAVLRVEGGDRPGDEEARLVHRSEDEEEFGPAPGLDELPALAERVRGAGVPVTCTVTGEPRDLPPGAGQCAYRVVQEALTNVLKHAYPARAAVTVAYEPRRLTVTVSDDGGRAGTRAGGRGGTEGSAAARRHVPAPPPEGGHGLIGMRERARIYGGRLEAGPRASGGFEVRLILPA
ncbi:sensor histidine kinase [Streptomyces albus]|uniref:histidine kinase n=1 Tax=Streptomyces albus TaxID=1888 RepID=A0A6C1CC90_9ACTN|nr:MULTISPECIES: histidine kinase [Streptomyces]KPC90098.1 histidine kinase [Streptomyces sp. NRRL F-6602]MDI6409575.1 histidine kinase [Streptomyces albus]QID38476.1 sensor histidine kinase [Streptomyces albus]TGG78028.1 sensor histidine kinase [Streptomyces albus]UVN54533.1 histidine kinase [Streptomyces albus]